MEVLFHFYKGKILFPGHYFSAEMGHVGMLFVTLLYQGMVENPDSVAWEPAFQDWDRLHMFVPWPLKNPGKAG
jgi:hypothetical protein